MSRMNDWFVLELENGSRIRCRRFMDKHAESKTYPYRVEMFWNKTEDHSFDLDMTSKIEEQLSIVMESDAEAFLTAVTDESNQYIYTWYCRNIEKFGELANKVLMLFPPLPISFFSTDDDNWTAYKDIIKILENSQDKLCLN